MRLVTIKRGEGERLGALVEHEGRTVVLDMPTDLPTDMAAFLVAGPGAMDRAGAVVAQADPTDLPSVDEVQLLAPVPRPRAVLCIGYNYRGHGAAGAVEDPPYPDVFAKTPNTVIGPGAPIVLPAQSVQVDYEAELAVVIGRPAHGVSEADAMSHVAGFTLFNDVSARDWQARSSQWLLGKSFDTFGPMGPALVTADEVPDLRSLSVELAINGRVTVHASTASMVFSVPFLVSYLSQVITLQPGDVIATGTPQKLPDALAEQRWMQPGDVVEVTVSGLGVLRNPVVAAPRAESFDLTTDHPADVRTDQGER